MAQVTNTICDGCKAVKGKTNHWFRLLATPTAFCVYPHSEQVTGRPEDIFDMCGQECLGKKLSEWMGKPVASEPEPRSVGRELEVEAGR